MIKQYFLLLITICLVFKGNAQVLVPVMNPIMGAANVCSSPAAGTTYSTSANNSPTSYQWTVMSPSTGITISNPNSSVTTINFPNTNLNYTIMCTATNSAGTSAPVIIIVKVYETPTVTFSGSQIFCQGSSTNLSASPTIISASSTLSYSWSPSIGLNTTTSANVVANPQITTTYSVLLTIATCTNLALVTITVNPLPSFTPVISNTLFCKGDAQTLTINGNANTYSINSVLTPTQSILTYSVAGGVLITVIGESSYGCASAASISFSVSNCFNDLYEIKKPNNETLNIFPNPNHGLFTIKRTNSKTPILIYNQMGALFRTYDSDEAIITITNFPEGLYIVTDGSSVYKLIIY